MRSTIHFLWLATTVVALGGSIAGTAAGGSIRYELTEFLGEHVYDGTSSRTSVTQWIDMPFSYTWPGIDESRIVIEGRVTTGQAHGDGVVLENASFELLPLVSVGGASFFSLVRVPPPDAYTPDVFRIEVINSDPFRHDTTPLPTIPGYPPLSFGVGLSVGLAPANQFHLLPARIDPSQSYYMGEGFVVDVPIVATIERAYVILTGRGVTVPEPSGVAVAAGVVLLAICIRSRNDVNRHNV